MLGQIYALSAFDFLVNSATEGLKLFQTTKCQHRQLLLFTKPRYQRNLRIKYDAQPKAYAHSPTAHIRRHKHPDALESLNQQTNIPILLHLLILH